MPVRRTCPVAPMTESLSFIERRWTSRDGLDLYARDYPATGMERGLPVVCLHGLTRNSRDFEELAPLIARLGRRVIAADVRGRGQSAHDPDPRHYHPRVYARDVADMLDGLGIDRAVFIGTSMGALITMALTAVRTRAIAGAVLNDAGPEVSPDGIARILGYAGKGHPVRDWAGAVEYARRTNGTAFPDLSDADWAKVARRMFRDASGGPTLDYDPAIAAVIGKPPSRLAGWIARMLFKRLARRAPLLLIRGSNSDIITADIAARMRKMAPAMQQVDVPGVGHAPMLDEPVAVDAITRFLRTVP